ncbi:MAG TPA: prepilin-type N-terminal cleavage/methylation domain-containing protein [bacterium]|nr:prepilin-type N-terminal cleavage/methylation domain-containing protein [bacterium]
MRRWHSERGFTMLEMTVVIVIATILIALSYTSWQGYTAQQRLRFGAMQVATDLREAEERAKAERAQYTIMFTGSSSGYRIQRTSGGFTENASLPTGVSPQASDTVTFTPFGQPDAAHTVTLQNAAGTRTASIDTVGGITYQGP